MGRRSSGEGSPCTAGSVTGVDYSREVRTTRSDNPPTAVNGLHSRPPPTSATEDEGGTPSRRGRTSEPRKTKREDRTQGFDFVLGLVVEESTTGPWAYTGGHRRGVS